MKNRTVGALISAFVVCVMCIGAGIGILNMNRDPVPAQFIGERWTTPLVHAYQREHFTWADWDEWRVTGWSPEFASVLSGLAPGVNLRVSFPHGTTVIQGYFGRGTATTGNRGRLIEELFIPNTVGSIVGHAFANNAIRVLIIPNSVTHIGVSAFQGNLLEYLFLPSSIRWMEALVFAGFAPFATFQTDFVNRTQLENLIQMPVGMHNFAWIDGFFNRFFATGVVALPLPTFDTDWTHEFSVDSTAICSQTGVPVHNLASIQTSRTDSNTISIVFDITGNQEGWEIANFIQVIGIHGSVGGGGNTRSFSVANNTTHAVGAPNHQAMIPVMLIQVVRHTDTRLELTIINPRSVYLQTLRLFVTPAS